MIRQHIPFTLVLTLCLPGSVSALNIDDSEIGQIGCPDWFDASPFTRAPPLAFFDENSTEALDSDAHALRRCRVNSLLFVLGYAYDGGRSYQRFARARGIER